jgi:hypothetical protein
MFDWLMRMIRRLFGGPHRPHDPLAGVRHPVGRRPGGNRSAVAVEEPDDEESLTLIGARR